MYSCILNGGKGDGYSTLSMKDWLDREKWIENKCKEPRDEEILKRYSLMFTSGKLHNLSYFEIS